MAIIYVAVVLLVMLGFCSFAVDLGRVQTAKTELRRAADAAARAGVASLPFGTSQVDTAAINMAANDKVDGTNLTLSDSNISVGIWNSSTSKFSSSGTANNTSTYQAVQVSCSQAIPLLFGEIIGMAHCTVHATSVAALVAYGTGPVTDYVSAHGNPWLAGQPAGKTGSVPDPGYDNPSPNDVHPWKYDVANPADVGGEDPTKVESTDYSNDEPYASPVAYDVQPGAILEVNVPLNSNNEANNQGFLNGGTGNTYANGSSDGSYAYYSDDAANPNDAQGTQTTSGSEHGISNIITPINSMVGVFLDQNGATYGADSSEEETESNSPVNSSGQPTAPGLDFSTTAAQNYQSGTTQSTNAAAAEMTNGVISPVVNQTFYAGSGENSSGQQMMIVVPSNAYAMFLGTMDGHEWSNNVGGFNATITEFTIELVQ
jgi:Flp pilus assembly protein TadG